MTYSLRVDTPGPTGPRRRNLTLLALLGAVALVCVIAAWRPWATETITAADETGAPAVAVPAPLVIDDDTRLLVFGDSWTYGSAATERSDGYAYVAGRLLGIETTVDGVRGSGYLKAGIDGPSFGDRIAALDPADAPDLIVLQGSINDRRLYTPLYPIAVREAWDRLASTYPAATIVVLGPAPQVLPVEEATAAIDEDLRTLADERDWWYISPLAEDWITDDTYARIIDSSDIGRDHPSTAGHAYLAERLVEALRARTAVTDAAADDTPPAA